MSRAYRSFIILTAATILSVGTLAHALSSQSSITADLLTAAGLILVIISSTLLVRVLRYLMHRPRPGS
ncbi:hypothetical protein ACIBL3_12180 [Kribbella sp. NPDC050124]|uniref:hypothetical protein n=1 Tax=Kribbella sp. NPDC050124 TaxID=3364114 RepID=UPI0037B548E3